MELLKRLPSNRKKKYPNQSIKQLIELKDAQLMSQRTISKHLERVSALINWAIKQGYISQNVFRGKLEPIRKTEVIEKYFTDQELNLILGNALKTESLAQNKNVVDQLKANKKNSNLKVTSSEGVENLEWWEIVSENYWLTLVFFGVMYFVIRIRRRKKGLI